MTHSAQLAKLHTTRTTGSGGGQPKAHPTPTTGSEDEDTVALSLADGVPVGGDESGAWVVFPDLALVRNKWAARAASRKKIIAPPPPRVSIRLYAHATYLQIYYIYTRISRYVLRPCVCAKHMSMCMC